MAQTLEQEYMEMPIITKTYITSCILTTVAVKYGLKNKIGVMISLWVWLLAPVVFIKQLDIISPFQLYFNPDLIFRNYQVWRMFTTFLFFGTFGFNFLFNIIFIYRYCRMLEEGSFRGRPADFLFMFIFGGTLMMMIAMFVNLLFLGQAFTIMLVYVWSRRNPYVGMNFFGILNFRAPYLPWVLLAFSVLLGNSIIVDLIGIAVGHVYYFLEDVCPNQPGGMRILKTPWFIKYIFENPTSDGQQPPPPEDRPGGFQWG